MSKKVMAVILALVIVMTGFVGCTAKNEQAAAPVTTENQVQKEVTLIVWHQFEAGVEDSLKKSFEKFTQENPNIKISFVKQNDLAQKITLLTQSQKDAPDIILGPNDWVGRFGVMGIIEPVSKYVDAAAVKNDHIASTIEAVTYNNELFGVPMTYECLTFMYNKKLLTTVPQTTDELLTLAKENTKDGKWGFVTDIMNAYNGMPWIYGFNGNAINNEGVPGLKLAESIDAASYIRELSAYMPKNVDYSVMDGLFKEGKALSIMNGSWAIKEYKSNANIDLGVDILPVITKSGKRAQPFLGVQAAMLTASSANKDAAAKALNYFGSVDVAKAFAESGYLVANKNLDLSSDPIAKKLSEQAALATPMPSSPEMSSVWEPLANALKEICTTPKADVKTVMEKAQVLAEEKIKASK